MAEPTNSTTSSGEDRGGTVLHLCSQRATVLDRFVRIAHSFGAEIRQRSEEACTVAFRGSAVSAARAVHAVCAVRDNWPADVRAAVVHALDVDGSPMGEHVRKLAALAGDGVVLLDETTAEQAAGMAHVVHELDVQLPDSFVAEPMFRVAELLASQPHRITIGREAERKELRRRVQVLSRRGRGAAITLIGPAGHGKSHLVDMTARAARSQRLRRVQIHIRGFGAKRPGAALASLLRQVLAVEDAAQLDGFVPADDLPFLMDALHLTPGEQALAMFDAMPLAMRRARRLQVAAEALAVGVARAPTLCIVEDLHWASEDMCALLNRLVVRALELPLLLLMSTRPEGRDLVRRTRELEVGALEPDEARTLARIHASAMRAPWMVGTKAYVQDDELERLVDVAQGNPLIIEQLAGAVELDRVKMAATVDAVVRSRLERLDPQARDDVILAAALGEVFDRETVGRAAGRALAWHQLVQSGLVRETAAHARFCHALIRDAIYEVAKDEERRRAHERLALAQREDRVLYARQLGLADSLAAGAAYLEAARYEDDSARPGVALTLVAEGLAHAGEWQTRAELLLLKGRLLVGAGNGDEAHETFEACLEGPLDAQVRCRALLGCVSALRLGSRLEAALPLLDEVEALARAHQLTEQLALAAYYRGSLLFARGAVAECGEQHKRAIELAHEAGVAETEALALSGLGDVYFAEAQTQPALEAFARCIALAREHGLGRIEVANLFMVGALRALENQPLVGVKDCLRCAEMARKVGHKRAEMLSRLNAGICLTPLGRAGEAAALITEAKHIAQQSQAAVFAAVIEAFEARNHLIGGRPARAQELALGALRFAEANDCAPFLGGVALGVLARATQGSERQQAIERGRALLARGAMSHNHFYFRQDAIEASLEDGDLDAVEALVADLEAYMAKGPIARQRLIAERARVLVAARRGHGDEARLRGVLAQVRAIGYAPMAAAIERELNGRV